MSAIKCTVAEEIASENEEDEEEEELTTPLTSMIVTDNKPVSDHAAENKSSKNNVEDEEAAPSPFVRGEPNTRLSKNIKKMFKSVINYQMNALNTLEKFYEVQVAKLEQDRQAQLKLKPYEVEKTNAYFNSQLKMLEERVQVNLNVICQNKNHINSGNNSGVLSQEKLSQKFAQLMLLKQIQQAPTAARVVTKVTSANNKAALAELKSNFLVQKSSLLPSKLAIKQSTEMLNTVNESQMTEPVFKRNLSLPFKQQNKLVESGQIKSQPQPKLIIRANSNTTSALTLSSTKAKYNKSHQLTSSPMSVAAVAAASATVAAGYQIQYQKKESLLRKVEAEDCVSVCSGKGFVKRQNKSISSLRVEDSVLVGMGSRNSLVHDLGDYQMPVTRLSDCHLQFRLKMATMNKRRQQQSDFYSLKSETTSNTSKLTFETQV